jgi:tetratricopeptide (TPR) repeat protein
MNYLRNWRQYILSKERLYSLLPIVAMLLIGIGYFLFFRSSILPPMRARDELTSQLASAQRDLVEAQKSQGQAPERLKQEVATAQAELDEAASIFLSESQAAELLNKLYQYASESGVEITNLQNQPGPQQEEKAIYDIRAFQLQAVGDLPNLVNFVSGIQEAALKGFAINNVSITEGEELHALTMDIVLYTSPYASGATELPTPGTPPATSENLAQLNETLAVAWASGDWARAIEIIRQILAIDPYYDGMTERLYTAYVNYGYQLLGEGDLGGAITQFNLALGVKPGGEEALAGLQQASTTPSPTLTVEEQLAQQLHEPWAAENWEEVIRIIEQILAINPNYDDMTEKFYAARVNYGYKLIAEGRLEEAKEQFILALTIKSDGEEAIAGLQQLAGETPSPTPTTQPQYIVHVVRQGETLYSIARQYNTTVQAIMAANGLTNYTIYVGQQLRIPAQ